MQRPFSKSLIFNILLIAGAVLLFAGWLDAHPRRVPTADAVVVGHATMISLPRSPASPIVAARLWRVTAADPRFGGVSALASDGDDLVALTDRGTIIHFAQPAAANSPLRVRLHNLPGGPGTTDPGVGRDSESLLRDPLGRGWWVGFELRHSLYLFDDTFSKVLARRSLDVRWRRNRGAEALVAGAGGGIFALPESGGASLAPDGGSGPAVPAGTADAARLPDGRLALLVRSISATGIVGEVRIGAGAGKPPLRFKLPLGRLANAEAIAAAPTSQGGTRLWVATDDNFRPWMRTYLLALDLPPGT